MTERPRDRGRRWAVVLVLACVSLGAAVRADDDADRILADFETRHRTLTQEYAGDLVVTSRAGAERRKAWRSYREGQGSAANRLIRFLGPPEVRGVAFLSRGRPGAAADQWMYLPAMKRERRIAPQDRESSFVGTDFNYEDLEEFDRTHFMATLVSDEVVDGHPCFVIDLVPRSRSVYVKKRLVLRKSALLPERMDSYRRGDVTPSKQLKFSGYVEVDGHWVAQHLEMRDVPRGSRTTLTLSDVRFDRPQPADRFTLQNLLREDGDDVAPAAAPRRSPARREITMRRPGTSLQATAPASRRRALFGASTGFLDTKAVLLPTRRTEADTRVVSWTRLFLRHTAVIGRVRVAAAVMAEAATAGQLGRSSWDPFDRQMKRSPLSLRELAVTVPVAPAIDIQAGRFVPAWGRTETYSPQDAFLPRDATDPLAAEKLPPWGIRVTGERGAYRFEAYRALLTTPWRLPRMDGRYSPFGAFDVFLDPATGDVPSGGFTVARVTRTGGVWDLGAWGRSGIRPAPLLAGDLDSARTESGRRVISPTRRFATEHAGGLEVGRLVQGWLLRGEVAVTSSPDPDLGTAAVAVFELERTAGNGTLLMTLAGNLPRPPINSLLLFDRASLPAAVLGWTQAQPWGQWKATWIGTLDTVGGLLRLETVNHLTDRWTLTLGGDLPHGARVSPLGAFDAARRVHSAVRVSW